MSRRLIKTALLSGGFDDNADRDEFSLRPKRLSEYIGQPRIKESLGIALAAAQLRSESIDHILLHGPPGLGKNQSCHRDCKRNGGEPSGNVRPRH